MDMAAPWRILCKWLLGSGVLGILPSLCLILLHLDGRAPGLLVYQVVSGAESWSPWHHSLPLLAIGLLHSGPLQIFYVEVGR